MGQSGADSPEDVGTSHGPAVLLIDDNTSTAQALSTLLFRGGIPTTVFDRGQAALRHAERHPLLAAIVDVHLPDMNGMVICQRLRDLHGPALPIVILSGDTSMATLNSLSYVGATHFFSKPVNAKHLLTELRGWIEESRNVAAE